MLDPEREQAVRRRIDGVPITGAMEMEILRLDDGYCEAVAPRMPAYDGIFASFHGGLLMTVADTAACWAVLTGVGADARLATTDMNIRFLAPCLTAVTARARVIKFGRTICPVAVDLFDAEGVHVAVAGVSYIILGGRG